MAQQIQITSSDFGVIVDTSSTALNKVYVTNATSYMILNEQ